MIGSTLARVSRPVVARQQRRGIVNWMTNYPDKVRRRIFILYTPPLIEAKKVGGRRWLPTADTIENVFIIVKDW